MVKRAIKSLVFPSLSLKIFKMIKSRRNAVFTETRKVATTTSYLTNGLIEIRAMQELDSSITRSGKAVRQKGVTTTLPNGDAHFQPYNVGTGERYLWPVVTANGGLKATKKSLIIDLKFNKSLSNDQMLKQITIQVDEIRNYIKSRKEKKHNGSK